MFLIAFNFIFLNSLFIIKYKKNHHNSMINLKKFLLKESRIGKLQKNIKIDIQLEKTKHANERQSRHGTTVDKYISDDEIKETVRAASTKMIQDILNDNLNIDDKFIVRDTNTNLNIVCKLLEGSNEDELLVIVITVLKTGKFFNQKDTNWVIKI